MKSWSYQSGVARASHQRQVTIVVLAALVAIFVAVAIILSSRGAAAQFYEAPDGQIAPALEARIARETHGRLVTVHFYSRALRKEADYLIYLPAGYRAGRPLPAFYLLHGMPGKPVAFTVNANIEVLLERLIRAGRVGPMLLVFPDGRIDGRTASDSEWANTPSGDYESYITNVVRDVDSRYEALPCREERAIAGRRPRHGPDPGHGRGAPTRGRPRVVGDLPGRPQLEDLDAPRRPDADHGQPRLLAPGRRSLTSLHLSQSAPRTARRCPSSPSIVDERVGLRAPV